MKTIEDRKNGLHWVKFCGVWITAVWNSDFKGWIAVNGLIDAVYHDSDFDEIDERLLVREET